MRRRAAWIKVLLQRESFTAAEAGEAAGCYGPDAVTRLRACGGLSVEIVGRIGRRRVYRVREVATVTKKSDVGFEQGVLWAIARIIDMYGEDAMAAEILAESGIDISLADEADMPSLEIAKADPMYARRCGQRGGPTPSADVSARADTLAPRRARTS